MRTTGSEASASISSCLPADAIHDGQQVRERLLACHGVRLARAQSFERAVDRFVDDVPVACRARLERRLRLSSLLIASGLIVELISLLWNHPTAFFLFLGVGVVLMVAGILFYFYSLVTIHEPFQRA